MRPVLFIGALLSAANITFAAEAQSYITPGDTSELQPVSIASLTDEWFIGYMRHAGMLPERFPNWVYFDDPNPVRQSALRASFGEEIETIRERTPSEIEIVLPPMPISLTADSYNERDKTFAIAVPGIVSPWSHTCIHDDNGRNLGPIPSFHLVYPDGLQAYHGPDGWVRYRNAEHARAETSITYFDGMITERGERDPQGNVCEPFRVTVPNTVVINVPEQDAADFFDAGFNTGSTEAWKRNPGLTLRVACRPTLTLYQGEADTLMPYQIACPITRMSVHYGTSEEVAYFARWNNETAAYDTSPGYRFMGPVGRTDYPYSDNYYLHLPHMVTLLGCGSSEAFVHYWEHWQSGFNYRIPVEQSLQVSVKELDGGIKICTNDPESLGQQVFIAWSVRR